MQVTQMAPAQAATTEEPTSGFRTIPTRIQDVPPLVVEKDEALKQEVVLRLETVAGGLAKTHRASAEAYLSQGMYEAALPHLDAAVTFAPGELEYRNQLGYIRYLTGDDTGAIEAFEHVLGAEPGNGDASFNLGMVLFGQKNFVAAEQRFAAALAQTPDDAETWNNRGVCLFQMGNTSDAKTCFERALRIEPDNQDAGFNLQNC